MFCSGYTYFIMSNKKLPYHTIHINDELTGTGYLIDTGAYCSVYPASHHERNIIDTDSPPPHLSYSSQPFNHQISWYQGYSNMY